MDVIFSIMQEEKPNQKEQFKIPKERISKYFAPGTPAQKIQQSGFYPKRLLPSQNQIQRIPIQRNRRNPMQSFGKKCVLITIISMLKNRLI